MDHDPLFAAHLARERRRSMLFDGALALAAAFLSVTIVWGFLDDFGAGRRAVVVGLLLAHTLCLFWRRRSPWTVLAVNLVTGLAVVALDMPMVVLALAPLVAVYSVAANVPRRPGVGAAVAGLTALLAAEALSGFGSDASTVVGNAVVMLGVWVIGAFARDRADYVRALEMRTTELQRARDELAISAVREERIRIARELHDVVAHSLSMIAVQSTAAAHVIGDKPDEARRALTAISEASHSALDEMRRLLGVLRSEDYDASLVPVPGLAELDALVEQVRATGPDVEARTRGVPVTLAPGLDLTAYRIVQESLTNVVKHARAGKVLLTLTYEPNLLVIEVVDDGPGPGTNGLGHVGLGIEGMRERTAMFGGTFEAGPMDRGGYRVEARLPLGTA